jgi:alkyl hydroperoxide reductase subunit AhpC
VDVYAVSTDSFQAHLDWIEKQGRKDPPDWHLVNGLLHLAQGGYDTIMKSRKIGERGL